MGKKAGLSSSSGLGTNDAVVARVGESVITAQMVQSEWRQRREGRALSEAPAESERQQFIKELVLEAALWEQIRKTRFDQSPEIQKRVRALIAGAYREKAFRAPTDEVNPSELQAWYEAHLNRYSRPAAVRAAVLLVAVPRTASAEAQRALAEKAEQLAQEAVSIDDAGFSEWVRRHSDDQATRYRGGETGWVNREPSARDRDAAWFDAVFAKSEPGTLAKPLRVPAGYQVVRLLEKREAGARPFSEVLDRVRHEFLRELQRRAEERYQEGLLEGLQVEVDSSRLLKIPFSMPVTTPPQLPHGVSATISP